MGTHLRVEPSLPPAFGRLRTAAWASNLGDGVRNAALPLLAATLSGSALTVAWVAAAGTLPFAVFGAVTGTIADRVRRVPLIIAAHVFRAGVMSLLVAAVLTDRVSATMLVGVAFLLGCGEAVADSAAPALVPELVADHRLEDANGELETAELVANDLAGPPIGGTLTGLAAAAPFVLDTVSFLSAAALVGTIQVEESHVDAAPTESWWRSLTDGLRASWDNRLLRFTAVLIVLLQLGSAAAIAPIVVYMTERLGLGPTGYGLFLGVGSLGGIVGARVAPRLARRAEPFVLLVSAVLVTVVALVLLAVPTVPVVTVGFAILAAGTVVGRIVVVAARQRSVVPAMLGRAQGTIRSLLWGAATVGAVIGGVLAEGVNPEAPFLFAAAVSVVAVAGTWIPLREVLVDHRPPRRRDDPDRPYQRQRRSFSRDGIQSNSR